MMIDAHTHLDVRSFEDLEKMALCSIETIITCSHDPYKMSVPEVYIDHWNRLINLETKRGELANISVKVAIGVHPMGYPKNWDILIDELSNILRNREDNICDNSINNKYNNLNNIVAIGETGLHYITKDEKNLLLEQLNLAKDYNMPIIIHTPEKNKKEALLEILDLLDKSEINNKLVMIDHINKETVDLINRDVYVGLTLQPPLKIDHIEATEIITEYNKKFILSSDLGSLKADIYALPRIKLYMEKNNINSKKIKNSTYNNAKEFYKL